MSLDFYLEAFDDPKSGVPAACATRNSTVQAIADAFGVHYATVSRVVSGKCGSFIPVSLFIRGIARAQFVEEGAVAHADVIGRQDGERDVGAAAEAAVVLGVGNQGAAVGLVGFV